MKKHMTKPYSLMSFPSSVAYTLHQYWDSVVFRWQAPPHSEVLRSKGLYPPLWFSSSLRHPIGFGKMLQILLLFLIQSSRPLNFTAKRPILNQRLKIVVRLHAIEHVLRSLTSYAITCQSSNFRCHNFNSLTAESSTNQRDQGLLAGGLQAH